MTQKEIKEVLKVYEKLQIDLEHLYSIGSPVVETSEVEGKIEVLETIMDRLKIAYKS